MKNKIQFNLVSSISNLAERQILETLSPFIWFYKNNLILSTLFITNHQLLFILFYFKIQTNFQFGYLADICAIDLLTKYNRFSMVYILWSYKYTKRIGIQTFSIETYHLPTSSMLYTSALWAEREVFDLFGIFFCGHRDLRRILTDYGFIGYPLRKNFPLTGYSQLYYNDITKQIESSTFLALQQEKYFLIVN